MTKDQLIAVMAAIIYSGPDVTMSMAIDEAREIYGNVCEGVPLDNAYQPFQESLEEQ